MVKAYIKYIVEVFFNISNFFYRENDKRKIWIFLTPQYLNYGDHAIALAEKEYLKKNFDECEVEEINYSFYLYWPNLIEKRIKKDDIIFLTGGGYAGDLWEENQIQLEKVIEKFPDNIVILAPQTIFFKRKDSNKKLENFKQLLSNHKQLYVLAREKNTYEFAEKFLGLEADKNLFILPDFALTLEPEIRKTKRKNIALCIRKDNEKVLSDEEIFSLKTSLKDSIGDIHMITMAKDHVEIPTYLRKKFLKKKFNEYAEKELVITDRLHGMIFAAITKTPCVALDNVSHKVSGVYQSLEQLSYIALSDGVDDILELGKQVTAIPQKIREEEFKMLNKEIISKYADIFELLIKKGI